MKKVPSILQMEAVECGAASLAMILAYHGRWVPLEEMRLACGVSRDGSNAANLLRAARSFGLDAKGWRKEPAELRTDTILPAICFWNFNHFLVLQGFKDGLVHLVDPAMGPREVSEEEFDESFTGVVLTFEKTPEFKPGGSKPSLIPALKARLSSSRDAVRYAVLAGLALVVPGLIIPTFSRIFVDDYLVNGMTDWIKPLLLGMALTAFLRGALTWLQRRVLMRMATKISVAGAGQFLWHCLCLPADFYTQRYSGDVAARSIISENLAQLLAGEVAQGFINILMVVFYAVLMVSIDPVLTLVGVGALCLNIAAARAVSQKRVNGSKRMAREQGKLVGVSLGGLQAIETLKATGSESDFFSTWAGHQAKLITYQQQLSRDTAPYQQVPSVLQGLIHAAVLGLGGMRVMDGHLTLGMLTAFQSLMSSFIEPLNACVSLMGSVQELEGDMTRLDDVMVYPKDPVTQQPENSGEGKLSGGVELRDITFGYSKLAAPLIEDFSLRLKPGMRVALVGPSGCGKSTVSKLVTGLYPAWKGEVLFDGKPRRELSRSALASSVALVDQDITLFNASVRDNLTLWDPTVSEERLVRACKDACIHDVIMARPGGYDAMLEEGGANLSGGQRQRLEIARALVLDPSILVLDEATSALDTVTEKRIDENLRRRGCTCVIIAHRLSTIRDADEIILLKEGKVEQRGTHDSLMAAEGPYAAMHAE